MAHKIYIGIIIHQNASMRIDFEREEIIKKFYNSCNITSYQTISKKKKQVQTQITVMRKVADIVNEL